MFGTMVKYSIHRVQRIVAVTAVLAALPGCTGADLSRAFGLERSVPDEYTVTTQAPLSMPPSAELNIPGEGGRKAVDSSSLQALETLAPEMALRRDVHPDSAGQSALVKEADQAAQTQGSGAEMKGSGGDLTDAILFWKGGSNNAVLDGAAENQRIRDATALGRNPSAGVTTVKPASKRFLGLF